jgi:hypothetical protein
MKSVNKFQILKYYIEYEVDFKIFLKDVTFEKEVGLLGNECRFLVKLINTFQTEVKKFAFKKDIILYFDLKKKKSTADMYRKLTGEEGWREDVF